MSWSLVMPWLAISWPAWCRALIVSGHFSTASPLAPMVALMPVRSNMSISRQMPTAPP